MRVDRFDPIEIFERDGWVCSLCSTAIDQGLSYPHPMSASIDHIVPVAEGGEHSRANVAAAHLVCNMRKGVRGAAVQLALV
ncbi:HNH endonuclease [Rhodococcus pyridinivorans]|uniref:HNH endonuclease n=1 Tax=Rhodococcus pyridinivorans TaxID=103816 RepID=A0A7M2XQ46_9NOCA|nr:HNH endonuclease signature motif containing protein [Rhodococcus pyridinivorans]QOV99523.1 HNH endonuclease [Rhodococcus pyridinivorans]